MGSALEDDDIPPSGTEASGSGEPSLALGMPDGFMCEPPSPSGSGSAGGVSSARQAAGVVPLQLPAWATRVEPCLNADPGADSLRLVLSSPVEPDHCLAFRCATENASSPPLPFNSTVQVCSKSCSAARRRCAGSPPT